MIIKDTIKRQGSSLLEALLYIALLSMIIVSIGTFYSLMIRERVRNNTISEVEQQGQFIIDNITQSIRNAQSISSPAPQASASSLTLIMQDAGVSPTIFSLASGNLSIQEGLASAINLNGTNLEVTSLGFTNMTRSGTAGNIKIDLTLRYKNPGSRYEYTYTKIFNTSASIRQ
ncbi:hypothetical protein HGB13_01885 [bacterium]|nr:hypothetical protein [bacterium]